jgi:hypothetical protein
METFFQLPSLAPANVAIKVACVAAACLVLWWLIVCLLLRVKGKYRGDLKFAIASFWAAIIVFFLLQIYTLLELNYNLGELGVPVMSLPNFYLGFIPEYLVGLFLIIYVLLKRKSILSSVNLKQLQAED